MRILLLPLSFLLLAVAACGSGSNGANAAPAPVGTVTLVIDTATGTDLLVQFQVAAATLERADGSTTANVLPAPVMVTISDPNGEADGLQLRDVPTGDYAALHLLIPPGSGSMLLANGTVAEVATAADLRVPFREVLAHSATGRSWIEVGHDGNPPRATLSQPVWWSPTMCGRVAGGPSALDGLQVVTVQGDLLHANWPTVGSAPIEIEFAAGCEFSQQPGLPIDRGAFLRGLVREDTVRVEGDLQRDGRMIVRRAHRHGRGHDGPRLIGRIVELRAQEQQFVCDVLAEVRSGGRRLLPQPDRVLVLAANAQLRWSHTHRTLAFGDLRLGQLAKVAWTTRAPGTSGLVEVAAREIEIAGGDGVPMRPEWSGLVERVDVQNRRIVVVPRRDDPIVVQGQAVTSVEVNVPSGTPIERRARRGPGRASIGLGDILPGQDRIWWRGTATGPDSIDANWIRVRLDD